MGLKFQISGRMRIAIEGCTHGELEKTYETIKEIEEKDGRKVDPSHTKLFALIINSHRHFTNFK